MKEHQVPMKKWSRALGVEIWLVIQEMECQQSVYVLAVSTSFVVFANWNIKKDIVVFCCLHHGLVNTHQSVALQASVIFAGCKQSGVLKHQLWYILNILKITQLASLLCTFHVWSPVAKETSPWVQKCWLSLWIRNNFCVLYIIFSLSYTEANFVIYVNMWMFK